MVHRTDPSVTVIAGALGLGAADGGLRTQRRRYRGQQAEMEDEPAASNAREARPYPPHPKKSITAQKTIGKTSGTPGDRHVEGCDGTARFRHADGT